MLTSFTPVSCAVNLLQYIALNRDAMVNEILSHSQYTAKNKGPIPFIVHNVCLLFEYAIQEHYYKDTASCKAVADLILSSHEVFLQKACNGSQRDRQRNYNAGFQLHYSTQMINLMMTMHTALSDSVKRVTDDESMICDLLGLLYCVFGKSTLHGTLNYEFPAVFKKIPNYQERVDRAYAFYKDRQEFAFLKQPPDLTANFEAPVYTRNKWTYVNDAIKTPMLAKGFQELDDHILGAGKYIRDAVYTNHFYRGHALVVFPPKDKELILPMYRLYMRPEKGDDNSDDDGGQADAAGSGSAVVNLLDDGEGGGDDERANSNDDDDDDDEEEEEEEEEDDEGGEDGGGGGSASRLDSGSPPPDNEPIPDKELQELQIAAGNALTELISGYKRHDKRQNAVITRVMKQKIAAELELGKQQEKMTELWETKAANTQLTKRLAEAEAKIEKDAQLTERLAEAEAKLAEAEAKIEKLEVHSQALQSLKRCYEAAFGDSSTTA